MMHSFNLYSYIKAFAHPADPKTKDVFDATYGRVAGHYPEAKGIVFVGESCEFPTRDERALPLKHTDPKPAGDTRPYAGWYPCRDYPDWLKAVKAAVNAGIDTYIANGRKSVLLPLMDGKSLGTFFPGSAL